MSVVVLGVDPGFASFGWALVELHRKTENVLSMGVIRTKKDNKKRRTLASDDNVFRAGYITHELISIAVDELAASYLGSVVAICAEAMSFPRSASVAAKMGMSWGVIAAISEYGNIPIVQDSPQKIKKKLVGNASASKEEIQRFLNEKYGCAIHVIDVPNGMHEHAYDALAAVVSCLDSDVIKLARKMTEDLDVTRRIRSGSGRQNVPRSGSARWRVRFRRS